MCPSTEQKKQTEFMTCPSCKGEGRVNNQICAACSGVGLGRMVDNHFVYWQKRINEQEIFFDKLLKKFNQAFDIFLILLGIGGLVALGYVVQTEGFEASLTRSFWRYQNNLLGFLYLGIVAQMFLFYRYSKRQTAKKKIRKKVFTTPKATPSITSLKETIKLTPEQKINIYEVLFLRL